MTRSVIDIDKALGTGTSLPLEDQSSIYIAGSSQAISPPRSIVAVDQVPSRHGKHRPLPARETLPFITRSGRSPLAEAADRLVVKRTEHNTLITRWLGRHPFVLLPISILVPIGLALVLYGIVPLGAPDGTFAEKLPKTLVVNPIVYGVYALTMTVLFYAVLDASKPWRRFRAYVPPVGTVLILQLFVDFLLYGLTDTFPLIGIVSFLFATATIMVVLRYCHFAVEGVEYKDYIAKYKSFRKILIFTAVFVLLLTLWVIGYKRLDDTFRILAPFIFIFVIHFNKRFLLTSGHDYPIELNMLISGLVLDSMDDVFQSLVFPLIPESQPFLFFLLVSRRFLENTVFLFFFTRTWFGFRVRANSFLKRFFTCRLKEQGDQPSFEDLDIDDRGHGNQRPAYLRRQTHWYFFRVLSQTHGFLNYLALAPVLRFGVNEQYFPLSRGETNDCLSVTEFDRSLWFGAIALGISWLTAVVGYVAIRRFNASTLVEVTSLYEPLITSPVYFGFIMLILLTSSLLAFNVGQFHNRIWFINGFDDTCLGV
eukprot:TRINITY_DN11340_c0_g1_i8.p1 TRINITY_DN11340_c0_g1~~TRINITY_DN11340_c0_g1_i8.p1  ORF type:complete len:538 (+),score=74.69 TRINITY_DN11340_c0_g1_i8:38-1651(+)